MPSAAGLLFLDPALCERTVFGALDSTVKIAVGKVVDDAATLRIKNVPIVNAANTAKSGMPSEASHNAQ